MDDLFMCVCVYTTAQSFQSEWPPLLRSFVRWQGGGWRRVSDQSTEALVVQLTYGVNTKTFM